MFNDLGTLLEIQRKDVEILALREKERELAAALSAEEEALQQRGMELEERKKELTGMKVARKDRELELDSRLAAIKKMELQLFQLRTNEEYQALQKEIESLKHGCSAVEDEILDLMERIEEIQKEIADGEKSIAATAAEIGRSREVLARERADGVAEIDRLSGEKTIIASSVSRALIDRYERTMSHYGNRAVVPVVDNVCQGCYTNLPRHAVEEIKGSGEPVLCQNCSRILYLDEA